MSFTGPSPSAGAELALTMADACADCGELRQALAHLDALRGTYQPVPDEYEQKRVEWTARLRAGPDTSPRGERRAPSVGLPA